MDKHSALTILGLGTDATRTEAKKAYRQLAKRCHPDRFSGRPGAADAEIRMKQLNAAFSLLVRVLPPEQDELRDNLKGAEPDPEKSTEAGKNARRSGKGFFRAFGEGLRAMAGPPKKRTPSAGKPRVSPGRREGTRRAGPRTARKKAPSRATASFEQVLRENSSGKGPAAEPSRARPAAPAGDPYARYVRLRQQLRMQRSRSRQGAVSRVEKITPVSPVPRVGDES